MTDSAHTDAPLQTLEALRSILPANAFSESELLDLVPMCQVESHPAQTVLITEGESSDNRVYFLLRGSVAVSIQGRFILRLQNQGDSIGEMGLISAAPRSATVTTETDTQLLAIDAADAASPDESGDYKLRYFLSRIFSSMLTEKLRTTSDRARLYEDLASKSERMETQRRSLEEEIATYLQQISLYSHLVNSAHDAILITDTAGRILNANRALMHSFSIVTDTVLGVEIAILLAMPNGEPGNWPSIADTARKGGWNGEVVIYHPDEGAIPADCSVSAVHDMDDKLLAYSVILRNIRERKRLEAETQRQAAELEQAYGQLQELERAKNTFLSMVSHELRTPISSILAYSELLNTQGMVEPEDREGFVHVIHKEAEKLSEMVNKVLAISKMESGEMLFKFAEAGIENPVRTVAAMQRPRAEAKGLTLNVHLPESLRPIVFDEENLAEAVTQLVDNAIKHTESGEIRIEVEQTESHTILRVIDSGVGLGGMDIETLLDRFGRGDSLNIGGHGLGLGLPLCYLIVKAHSGSLRLRSRPEQGTEVSISLPTQTPNDPSSP